MYQSRPLIAKGSMLHADTASTYLQLHRLSGKEVYRNLGLWVTQVRHSCKKDEAGNRLPVCTMQATIYLWLAPNLTQSANKSLSVRLAAASIVQTLRSCFVSHRDFRLCDLEECLFREPKLDMEQANCVQTSVLAFLQ